MYLDLETIESLKRDYEGSKLEYEIKQLSDYDSVLFLRSLKIHKLNKKLTPKMDREKFMMFAKDVIKNGLKEPIIVWKKRGSNFIIDGKHRYWLFKILNIDIISVKFLNTNYTKEQIMDEIVSRDITKKNMSKSQQYLSGYEYLLEIGDTKENRKLVQKKFRITSTDMSKIRFIHKWIPKDYILIMKNLGVVTIDNKPYRSIDTLYRLAKQRANEVEQNKLESNIKSQEDDLVLDNNVFNDVQKHYNNFLSSLEKALNISSDEIAIKVKRKINNDIKKIFKERLIDND